MLQQRQQEQEERLAKVSLHVKFCTGRGEQKIIVSLHRMIPINMCVQANLKISPVC